MTNSSFEKMCRVIIDDFICGAYELKLCRAKKTTSAGIIFFLNDKEGYACEKQIDFYYNLIKQNEIVLAIDFIFESNKFIVLSHGHLVWVYEDEIECL